MTLIFGLFLLFYNVEIFFLKQEKIRWIELEEGKISQAHHSDGLPRFARFKVDLSPSGFV